MLPSTLSVSVSRNSNPIQEASESTAENVDRPSLVPVLKPFFEDINGPERSETDNGKNPFCSFVRLFLFHKT